MSNRRKLPRDPEAKHKLILSPSVQAYVDKLDGLDGGSRRNSYICKTCGGVYVTVDIDPGVTPMFMRCYATEGCEGEAHSTMYSGAPAIDPTLEWYRPETTKGQNPAMVDHLRQGGLVHRAAATAPAWVKLLHGPVIA